MSKMYYRDKAISLAIILLTYFLSLFSSIDSLPTVHGYSRTLLVLCEFIQC